MMRYVAVPTRQAMRKGTPAASAPPIHVVEALESRTFLSAAPTASVKLSFQVGTMTADTTRDVVYLTDATNLKLLAFDTDLARTSAVQPIVSDAAGLAVSPAADRLYVSEPAASSIEVF